MKTRFFAPGLQFSPCRGLRRKGYCEKASGSDGGIDPGKGTGNGEDPFGQSETRSGGLQGAGPFHGKSSPVGEILTRIGPKDRGADGERNVLEPRSNARVHRTHMDVNKGLD